MKNLWIVLVGLLACQASLAQTGEEYDYGRAKAESCSPNYASRSRLLKQHNLSSS